LKNLAHEFGTVETLEEAQLLLDTISAERERCRLEKLLAKSRFKESYYRVQLERVRYKKAGVKFLDAGVRLGGARYVLRQSKFPEVLAYSHPHVVVKRSGGELP
jgi:hypothetical protein